MSWKEPVNSTTEILEKFIIPKFIIQPKNCIIRCHVAFFLSFRFLPFLPYLLFLFISFFLYFLPYLLILFYFFPSFLLLPLSLIPHSFPSLLAFQLYIPFSNCPPCSSIPPLSGPTQKEKNFVTFTEM